MKDRYQWGIASSASRGYGKAEQTIHQIVMESLLVTFDDAVINQIQMLKKLKLNILLYQFSKLSELRVP